MSVNYSSPSKTWVGVVAGLGMSLSALTGDALAEAPANATFSEPAIYRTRERAKRLDQESLQIFTAVRKALESQTSHTVLVDGLVSSFSVSDEIARQLAEIDQMEAEPGSVFPPPSVVKAAEIAADYIPSYARTPMIELDDSTGSLAFIWCDKEQRNSFSLEIPNDQIVLGIGAGPRGRELGRWVFPLRDDRSIRQALGGSGYLRSLLV